MIVIWTILLAFFLWFDLGCSGEIRAPKMGVPEPLKVWSALKFLLRHDDDISIAEFYPIVTGLEDLDVDIEISAGGESLQDFVSSILSVKYGRSDLAYLLPLYCDAYPMGSISDDLIEEYNSVSGEMFFQLNGKRYENSDDVFYLKSSELKQQALVVDSNIVSSDDVIIGDNGDSPLIIFYGCPDVDGVFEEFNRNLYSEAINTGKFRYVWRPTCQLEDTAIKNIPISLSVRQKTEGTDLAPLIESFNIPKDYMKSEFSLYHPSGEELKDLDVKVASMIAKYYESSGKFKDTVDYAQSVIDNFPLLIQDLASSQQDTKRVLKSNERLKKKGIDYQMLGLYINGQNWKVSSLDQTTLLDAISAEYFNVCRVQRILARMDSHANRTIAKLLVDRFSQYSLPNLRELQPVKLDLHRIPGFSESIIYFNDIERDSQYNDLTDDVEQFFEKSKFGEIPEYRSNWNELIFVIDFGSLNDIETQVALEGLNRAIEIMSQGYPQRIGLLPLSTGTSDDIIRRIYEIKHSDLLELEKFLKNLSTEKVHISCNYKHIPDVSRILNELQIFKNSIIVNGEIYPFKKNTWHYLVAKVVKEDTAYLKKALSKYSDIDRSAADVRKILHLKSADIRDNKYTPDYFSDAIYTFMNNTALYSLKDRTLTYTKGYVYNIIHTVTLVDDFNTKTALLRLRNILQTNFSGVRIRAIHTGSLSFQTWLKLESWMSKELIFDKFDQLVATTDKNIPKFELDRLALAEWLPELPKNYLNLSSFLILNGRFIHFENYEVPSRKMIDGIIKREAKRTLDVIYSMESLYPSFSDKKVDSDFIEMLAAALTKMFYQGTQIYQNGPEYTPEATISRMDFSGLFAINNYTSFQSCTEERPIELFLLMDPLEERSQKFLKLVELAYSLPFVNCKIVILPTEALHIMPISRFYLDEADGSKIRGLEKHFQIELESPSNLYVSNLDELEGVVIEIHAFTNNDTVSTTTIEGVGGVCFELIDENDNVVDTCITMTSFGYGQFIANKLFHKYRVRSCDSRFQVTSFATDARSDYVSSEWFALKNLNPVKVHVEVEQVKKEKSTPHIGKELNVYSVLKNDLEEEENYKKMVVATLSSSSCQGEKVKFWILDQPYITESFKKFCEAINQNPSNHGTIEFLKYSWPLWLRPQTFNSRKLDSMKLMFLDVLFPLNVSKLLYVDPTSTPIDLIELSKIQNFDTPLAMFKATGSGYWNEGYWANMLSKNKLKFYSIKPAAVINLEKFRHRNYGDKLRLHYQRLTADPRSLVKIDQDLVNDLQLEVPITNLRLSHRKTPDIDQDLFNSHVLSIEEYLEKKAKLDSSAEHDQEYSIWHDEL